MWKNYFKVAIRNSWKNKTYLIINVIGLGTSMAFCLTIYLVFAFNWEFDGYYRNTENIYRIHELKQNTDLGLSRLDIAPMPMGPMVAQQVASVGSQTRYIFATENLAYKEEVFNDNIGYVDSNFFDFFKISLRSGSYASLKDKSSIYLTQVLAKKYFGDTDPLGKIMTIHNSLNRSVELTVAGVFNRIPLNSSFQFGALTNIENALYGHDIKPNDWTASAQPTTFLRLTDAANAERVEKQLNRYVDIQNKALEEWKVSRFELVGFKDRKLVIGSVTNFSNCELRINMGLVTVLTSMAILIFLIACFNLANTTMALMGSRVKEVGVRKVMGGTTSQVFLQFMFEMLWTSLMALLFGLVIFQYISESFFSLWNKNFEIQDMDLMRLIIAFAIILMLTTVIAGMYPALYSKKFQPVAIFHNRIKLRGTGITSILLNAMQFSLSIMVLAGGLMFLRNVDFIRSLDLGYQRENIINIQTEDKTELNLMRDKIKNNPDILAWSVTDDQLGGHYENSNLVLDTGIIEIRSRKIGMDYLKMMNIRLIEGRLFNTDMETDYADAVIVNQAYVDRFNVKNPVGKMVNLRDGKRYIIGVTSTAINSVFKGHEIIPEIYLAAKEDESLILVVKTSRDKKTAVFNFLAKQWKDLIQYRPFSGIYQDDVSLKNTMTYTRNIQTIFLYLAILGALLSLTGIFALSSLNVASRLKEIGIRKVMGATSRAVLLIMNRKFIILLAVSVVAGIILSYYLNNTLLSIIYEYHTTVQPSILIFSGFLISFLALLTTSLTIYKASITNPSKILRID